MMCGVFMPYSGQANQVFDMQRIDFMKDVISTGECDSHVEDRLVPSGGYLSGLTGINGTAIIIPTQGFGLG